MEINQYYENPLRYGKTDNENIPFAPADNYFVVGHNSTHGLIYVCNDEGTPSVDGAINIENLLANIKSNTQEEKDSKVENHIMDAYINTLGPNKDSSKPTLESLTNEV